MKKKIIKCNSWKLKKEENKNIVYKHPSYNTDTYHHAVFSPWKLNNTPPYLAGEREEISLFYFYFFIMFQPGNGKEMQISLALPE